MAKPKISDADLCRNAKRIKTGVAEIKTFLAVETKNKGFDSQDRPLILFERHIFHKLTKGKYDSDHPNISNKVSGGYGSSASQYSRFSAAFKLNPDAAMKSTSWGLGQVMGFNHKVAGYDTVNEFVDAMKESEGKQLDAAISFIIHNNLADDLRNHNWAGFAKGYNGAGYRKNAYDTKLAQFYAKFSKELHIDCDKISKVDRPTPLVAVGGQNPIDFPDPFEGSDVTSAGGSWDDATEGSKPADSMSEGSDVETNIQTGEPGEPVKAGEPAPDSAAKDGEAVVGGRPQDNPIIVEQAAENKPSGWKTWPTTVTATLGSLGLTVGGIITQLTGVELSPQMQSTIGWLIIIGIIVAATYGLFYLITRALASSRESARAHAIEMKELELRSMPDRYNVKLDRRDDVSNLTLSGLSITDKKN
ncbi:hypothetical protein BH09PAT1_BH09PAT1_1380 [soil metagenome]